MIERKYSNGYLISRFFPYFVKYRLTLFIDLFCAAMSTLCDLTLPLIIRYITNTGMKDMSLLSSDIIIQLGFLYFFLRLLDTTAHYYMANIGHVMGAKIETDMRRDVFEHLQNLSHSFYNNTKVGQIMSRITTDLFDVTEFAHHCPEEFFIGGLKIIIAFTILVRINPILTVVLFLFIPLMIFSVSRFNRKMRAAFKLQRNHIGDLNAGIEDTLLGIKVVKSFANEDIEKDKFEQDNMKFLGFKKLSYRYLAFFHTMSRIFDGLMFFVVIVMGGLFMLQGKITAGDLFAYTLYVNTLLSTVRRIVEFMEQFQRGMTGIERFVEIMDTPADIVDKPEAVEMSRVEGEIVFNNVSFKYESDYEEVLQNISFRIPKGHNVALVGPSGAGKTTICNLIPRFYNLTGGEIRIDGRNIEDFTLKSLRSNIGIVQQDVYLFSGTIFENIEYGRPGASMDEVIEAARLSDAYDFIMGLPNGFDTYVGERGVKLSGGQKQRISIARVFLKNPPLLILDEATSSLDNQSEGLVQQSLEKLSKGRTTLTIAHRLSTIRKADTIFVLTQEGIVEEGNHESLLQKKGIYHELYTYGNMPI